MGCAVGAALLFSAGVSAQSDHWVSDKLPTFVRSGPTDGYRIVGTLDSGDPVTVLQTQGDYTQVRGPDGDEVWIQSRFVQDSPSAQQQLPALRDKVSSLTQRLDGIDDAANSPAASSRSTSCRRATTSSARPTPRRRPRCATCRRVWIPRKRIC